MITMAEWHDIFFYCTVFVLLFFCIPIKVNSPKETLFLTYVDKYHKEYKNNETELNKRFETFQATLDLIEELNNNRTFNSSARYGLTRFSDLSQTEFLHKHLVHDLHERIHNRTKNATKDSESPTNKHKSHHRNRTRHKTDDSDEIDNSIEDSRRHRNKRAVSSLPLKIDWREKGFVSKVYNQKTCGACWAFSTTEMIESINAIKTGTLQELSVQEMIDCSTNGNQGCEGGDICSLLEWLYVKQIKIESASEYPLELSTDVCKLKGPGDGLVIADYTCQTFVNKEDDILTILATQGPVAVAVNALSWQNYLGGVVQFHCDGSPGMLNHAVELVGYDMTAEIPHYIARNSWGLDFGDKGYIYIAIGGNICGVATEVATVVL